ncbi:hypothetical protein [Fulvivirga ligni]|uniref:hypothetical protein n=1 Tax=Fulvivirga ligni TaxID=2904246 RepID=UPI001F2796CB|nr:hypothetical protein [Fulvivirga ligni]UII22579.1 hypothetical protein LVD16_04980 [Fulvivirga ligni]
MKRFTFILTAVFATLFFASCEGPQGPPGLDGLNGQDGVGELAHVFEYENVSFTAANDYSVTLNHPNDFEGYDSDVTLVYFFQGEDSNGDEIWWPLPETVLIDELGILQYKFDFTKNKVILFLDSDFDLDLLGANDTDNWLIRVVVVPGEFWNSNGRRDMSYQSVKEMLGLPDLPTPKVSKERQ